MINRFIAKVVRVGRRTALKSFPRASLEATVLREFLAVEALSNDDMRPARSKPAWEGKPELTVIAALDRDNSWRAYLVPFANDEATDNVELLFTGAEDPHPGLELIARMSGASYQAFDSTGLVTMLNVLAEQARGEYLLFIPSGVRASAHIVRRALAARPQLANGAGAVVGLLADTRGRVVEAGVEFDRRGRPRGREAGRRAQGAEVQFRRDVAGFERTILLTTRATFLSLNGFDVAYPEEHALDYSIRLSRSGRTIRYEPTLMGIDLKTTLTLTPSKALTRRGELRTLTAMHGGAHVLAQSLPAPTPSGDTNRSGSRRILFLEDRAPHPFLGQGYPRSHLMVQLLGEMGHHVTIYPLRTVHEEWASVYQDLSRDLEVQIGMGRARLPEFLKRRLNSFDMVLVSRPHNMQAFMEALQENGGLLDIPLLYDAEALFSLRDIELARLRGQPLSAGEADKRITDEVQLARRASAVIAVSDAEGSHYAARGISPVFTLGHAVTPAPTPHEFADRHGFLFVGPLAHKQTPNGDGLIWFCSEVLPLLRQMLGSDARLTVAGTLDFRPTDTLVAPDIQLLGRVEDLVPRFNSARVFVAPVRFAAGIPLKIYEAAAHGLPIVATPLLASQLSWTANMELLCGSNAEQFAAECARLYRDAALWTRIRASALAGVERDASQPAFAARLHAIFDTPRPSRSPAADASLLPTAHATDGPR